MTEKLSQVLHHLPAIGLKNHSFSIREECTPRMKPGIKGLSVIMRTIFAKTPTARHIGVVDPTNYIFSKTPKFELSHEEKIWAPRPLHRNF